MRSIAMRFLLPFGIVAVLFSIFIFRETYVTSQHHANDLVGQQAAMAMEFNLAIREYVSETVHPIIRKIMGKNEFIPEMIRHYGLKDDGRVLTDFELIEMDEGRWYPDMWRDAWK